MSTIRSLSDLTLDELWEKFPIELKPNSSSFKDQFYRERDLLRSLFNDSSINIYHIGSTAIGNILSKPIVDILVELPDTVSFDNIDMILQSVGYLKMSESTDRRSFNKGYTINGYAPEVFHLHLRKTNDHDELYFRDYLIEHPEKAQDYEILKIKLAKQFKYNRDAYTEAKSEFVYSITNTAKNMYKGRYE